MIVDLRGQATVQIISELAPALVTRRTAFARFTLADLSNPGAFVWNPEMAWLSAGSPHYPGKVVVLVDELTQSHLEFTAMALRSAPGSLILGGTTAGADGNTSDLLLPGNLRLRITGGGVFYPDGRKTQQVGIIPDVRVAPTIEGIRQGRDEVLEAAERLILQ